MDFLHDGRRSGHGEPAAAVLLRDQRGEKTRLGERLNEFGWIDAIAVQSSPILARKAGAQRPHRLADRREVGITHGRTSARPLFMTMTFRSGTSARKLTTAPSTHISVRIV